MFQSGFVPIKLAQDGAHIQVCVCVLILTQSQSFLQICQGGAELSDSAIVAAEVVVHNYPLPL